MTHIILLDDGKIWAFKPPERPEFTAWDSMSPASQPSVQRRIEEYQRAYSLALEKKIEVENMYDLESILFDPETHEWWLMTSPEPKELKENEPIKWEGGYEVVGIRSDGKEIQLHRQDQHGFLQSFIPGDYVKTVVRLIAPVKEETTLPRHTVIGQGYHIKKKMPTEQFEHVLHKSLDAHGLLNKEASVEPVPSEQEKQEAMWSAILDFCSDHHTKPLKYLTENFTITRK